jgi:TRAP-type C4-dicarboxylate transport system permease small subunit
MATRSTPQRGAASAVYAAARVLTDAAAAIAALSVLASLLLVCYSVGMRYAFNDPVPWVDEAVGYVLVASVMFSIAEALRKGEHIAVDILTERLGTRAKRTVYVGGLIAVVATAVILIVEGWGMVAFSRMIGIRSIGYLDIPIWTVQVMVPAGGLLLLLAALAELLRIAAGLPPEDDDVADRPDPDLRTTGID